MAQDNKRIDIIGSVELINFPETNIRKVPARIDTGAIFSSIWASNVKLSRGTLSFRLFAPGSALYDGATITTKEFRTSSIKNSFGQSEFRYKVRLQAEIGDRKMRAWFTLADRSGMTYPVLVGRNILRNKFIVDVSRRKTHGSSSGEVLVLASEGHDFDDYFADIEKLSSRKTKYLVRDYKDLVFSIMPGRVSVVESLTGRDIGDFDLIFFKSHKRDYPVAMAAAEYVQFRGVKIVDQELSNHVSYDKLAEYLRLALHNLPVPQTICAPTQYFVDHAEYLTKEFGWPLVCKEIEADRGRKNYLLDNVSELKGTLAKADTADIYVIQKYIPNEGFIRALVLDREVALALQRTPIKRDEKLKRHLNKLPYSDNVVLVPLKSLNPLVHDLSVRASVVMNRQVAGVDMIQDVDTKEWFILEVNSAPQIKSGPFLDERKKVVAKFFDRELYS